jgi:hypothetical protein
MAFMVITPNHDAFAHNKSRLTAGFALFPGYATPKALQHKFPR